MLHTKIKISKMTGVDIPLDINITDSLPETKKWISPMHLTGPMEYTVNELKSDFDALLDEYEHHFNENQLNTRTGYGQPVIGGSPMTNPGKKNELVDKLKIHKKDIIAGKAETLDILNRYLYDNTNDIGVDTVNDFIIFMNFSLLHAYNQSIFNELTKDPSLKSVSITQKEVTFGSPKKRIKGLCFDGIGPIFLLPEAIFTSGKMGFVKSASYIATRSNFINILSLVRSVNKTAIKNGISKRVLTMTLNKIFDKKALSISDLETASVDSQTNDLINLVEAKLKLLLSYV